MGVRPGGVREEDVGVPPLQGLAHSGPLGPEFGAAGVLDGGRPDWAVPALLVGVPPPVPGPSQEVLEAQDPGEQPHKGPSPALVGGGEHQGGLAVPAAQRGEAMVPPPVPGEGGRRGRVPTPSPPASSSSSRSTCHRQKRLVAGHRGAKAGRIRVKAVVGGGGGGASCRLRAHPNEFPVSRRALSARPVVTARSGGGGGKGGGGPLTHPWLRTARGIAAAPQRLGPFPSSDRPTLGWGPMPPPGRSPPTERGPEPSPRRGAPSWAAGV